MVTTSTEHGATDLDNDLIMPLPVRHSVFLAIVLAMSAPLAAQQAGTKADGEAVRKSLNLSLPREAAFPPGAMTQQDPTLRNNLRAPSRPADPSDNAMVGRTRNEAQDGQTNAPYGTGFEARQRGFGGGLGGGSGGGAGGGFGGGGRGMGRGR